MIFIQTYSCSITITLSLFFFLSFKPIHITKFSSLFSQLPVSSSSYYFPISLRCFFFFLTFLPFPFPPPPFLDCHRPRPSFYLLVFLSPSFSLPSPSPSPSPSLLLLPSFFLPSPWSKISLNLYWDLRKGYVKYLCKIFTFLLIFLHELLNNIFTSGL